MSPRRITMSLRPEAPTSVDAWVREGDAQRSASAPPKGELYTARLTLDVTPELRGRIKLAAFRQGVTVAELLRRLLEREIPSEPAPFKEGS